MAFQKWWTLKSVSIFFVVILAALIPLQRFSRVQKPTPSTSALSTKFNATDQSPACVSLARRLPEVVFTDQHPAFHASVNSFWSSNAREAKPDCIFRPLSVNDVSSGLVVLKQEFDHSSNGPHPLKFALRSGGHSPEVGFGAIEGGVGIDMSAFDDVLVADDRQIATIGAGARWRVVAAKLDPLGLAVIGGRDADTGVGGLVLGGGISFFSPRFGMVCDNIVEYELVLANGTVLSVSEETHSDLWKALKGGSANFGILTSIKARTVVSSDIFAGYLFYPSWSIPKVLEAFHSFNKPENFDKYAAGPILASSYVADYGVRAAAISLVYTKAEKWPRAFARLRSIWRIWSTMKIQSLSRATHELHALAPGGHRQFQVTTTIKNDFETIDAFHQYFLESIKAIKKVRGMIWSIVYQPLSAAVTRKGSPNVLGLETRHINDTLIIVLMSMSWEDSADDELTMAQARQVISRGEAYAARRGTSDAYRYLNYAASKQDPILSYGAANVKFLQEVSSRYDPDGFFQKAKQGHFKLHMYDQ